jgi:hypothetical protein
MTFALQRTSSPPEERKCLSRARGYQILRTRRGPSLVTWLSGPFECATVVTIAVASPQPDLVGEQTP